MITAQEFLSSVLQTTQLSQHMLSLSAAAASSHALKSILQAQIQEYDRIESEIQILAARRGWELWELQPAARWLAGIRFHRRTDSSIAEHLINLHTKDTVSCIRLCNQWDRTDGQILTLFQKFLDCKTMNIRQMQPYL